MRVCSSPIHQHCLNSTPWLQRTALFPESPSLISCLALLSAALTPGLMLPQGGMPYLHDRNYMPDRAVDRAESRFELIGLKHMCVHV
eukprot:1146501-Pelagomonas_calceolata.AAC.3